jgi:hypothetical protein
MAKVHRASDGVYLLWCPGCLHAHGYDARWTFSGDFDRPTFKPSLDIKAERRDGTRYRCHSFVTAGVIEFLADSTHQLRGQAIEIEDF